MKIKWTTDSEGCVVARDSLPTADAERAVKALADQGHEASCAPDHDDDSQAWVYVTWADDDIHESSEI